MKRQRAARHLPPFTPLLLAICTGAVSPACVPHIAPYTPKRRSYEPPVTMEASSETVSPGSLWRDSADLFRDLRAHLPGDIVLIRIEERTKASGDAETSMKKGGSVDLGADAMLGFMKKLAAAAPDIDTKALVKAAGKLEFDGKGSTSRTDTASATVTATVMKVFTNGNMFVEGHKVVMINREELHLYISGVIRPEDIGGDNSVESHRLADVEIEITGRGAVSDAAKPGWFLRLMAKLWPF